jgi:hypothetical protein
MLVQTVRGLVQTVRGLAVEVPARSEGITRDISNVLPNVKTI